MSHSRKHEVERARHGGAYDRGRADSYYRRPCRPHYFKGGTYTSEEVLEPQMTPAELADYHSGFDDNEADGFYKYPLNGIEDWA